MACIVTALSFAPTVTLAQTGGDCINRVPVVGTDRTEDLKVGCPPGYKAGDVVAATDLASAHWSETIYQTLASLGALFAWLGGSLLDVSIDLFTVGMGRTAEEWGFTSTIVALWSIVRDLFNILFIFGLIWAGFKLILGDDSSKRLIGSIVVAALLINFSLYATQVVVDFANVAAYQIHSAIKPPEGTDNEKVFGYEVTGISANFVNMANLDNLKKNNRQMAEAAELPTSGLAGNLILGILMLLFYGLLGFVFAAGAFILFSRFIALLFLMIFSPVLFLGWILPGMKGISSKWTQYLFNQSLVGPAFLFMLYIALRAMQGLGELSQPTITSMIVYVLIVAAFVIAALRSAQSMSSWGALQAYNVGQMASSAFERRVKAAAGGATAGLAARGLRNTIGRRADQAADSEYLRDKAETNWLAKRTLNLSNRLKDATFDVRNTKSGGALGLGTGLKDGYVTSTKKVIDREKAFADSLGMVSDDDPKVAGFQLEVDAVDKALEDRKEKMRLEQENITELERQKKAAETAKEKAEIQAQIDVKKAEISSYRSEVDKLKEDLDKKKEVVEREKSRRQLGTIPKTVADDLRNKRDLIKKKLVSYAGEKDEVKQQSLRDEILKLKKEYAEAEKEANKQAGGYAAKLENYGRIKSWFIGRSVAQNKEAGKEIRKDYQKKIKSKDK